MRLFRLWAPPAALAGVIYALSSMSQVPGSEYVSDKLAHVAVYGMLAVLTLRATHGGLRPLQPVRTAAAATLVIGWGVLDELHQRFVPGRHASALDVVADGLGVAVALVLWVLWQRRMDRGGGRPAGRTARTRTRTGERG